MEFSRVITANGTGSGAISISEPKYLDANALVEINEYLDKRIDDLSKNPLYQHKCQNCGGTVELDYDKAIFICPYCDSHYALAPNRINDVG